jgi:hypothetical protein
MASDIKLVGTPINVPLQNLRLDDENPRLAGGKVAASQADLALHIAMAHDSLIVAQSIARHGFFANEPLIVIEGRNDGEWVVVEGNRRLTALLGLADSSIRSQFFEPEPWNELAKAKPVSMATEIPCIQVSDRRLVSSIIGFRHISGILDWSPYAQAAFIAQMVDEQGYSFLQVSEMIGKRKSDVANLYRNFKIAKQAQESGVSTVELENAFSLLTVAMSSPHLRDHIGATSGTGIEKTDTPVPTEKVGELKELIGWVFGTDTKEAVLEDSRHMSRLGRIVSNDKGLEALRKGAKTLDAAEVAMETSGLDPIDRLTRHVKAALNALKLAVSAVDGKVEDASVHGVVAEIEDELTNLQQLLNGE